MLQCRPVLGILKNSVTFIGALPFMFVLSIPFESLFYLSIDCVIVTYINKKCSVFNVHDRNHYVYDKISYSNSLYATLKLK